MSTLPLLKAHELPTATTEHAWLVESLWAEQAVGLIGGEPKCCKSFLALSLALSVATGHPCLGRFPVRRTGPVLVYAAEDALSAIRSRLTALSQRYHMELNTLELYFITVHSLRLDRREDCIKLAHTVETLKPALVVLDPFVRLHRVDENVSQEIVPLLAILRELQRRYGCAVALVHHAKKGASHLRAGQALRGSSEFHAWSDSGLYLRRRGDKLHLTVEHRAHPAPQPMWLRLESTDGLATLTLEEHGPEDSEPADEELTPELRVMAVLATTTRPLRVRELRELCKLRTQTLCAVLETLTARGSALKTPDGFLSAGGSLPAPISPPVSQPPVRASSFEPIVLPESPSPPEEADPRQARFPFLAVG